MEWLVFSPAGEWLGSVGIPVNFTMHQAGKDFLLGSWRDELGVESVRVYAIQGRE